MSERFTHRLWGSIDHYFESILQHPFIRGLTDGSLDHDAFAFYVVQDALYLKEFARALAVCGAKAPDESAIRMFSEHAAMTIAVERELHAGFLADLGLSEDEISKAEPAPTNLAYTSYLLATTHGGSFPEALGAVLPCYWIYWEVGKALRAVGSPDPLYQRWIEMYSGEEFSELVRKVLALADHVGEKASVEQQDRMTEHFRTTGRFEWMFWDMGYRKEGWPV